MEKAVDDQIKSHLKQNRLLSVDQTAYRAQNSPKTALLQMQEYILSCTGKGEVVLLALLGLSFTFLRGVTCTRIGLFCCLTNTE